MKRDAVIDCSKGIGIMLVILGHLVYSYGMAFRCIFAFHMPLFYLLMGMIFPYRLSLKKYLHKSKKLLLSYIAFLMIGIVVTFAVPSLRENFVYDQTTRDFLFRRFQPECFNVGQIWFLFNSFVVITLYFFFSSLVFLFPKGKTKTKEIVLAVIIIIFSLTAIVVFNKSDNAFYIPILNIKTFMRPALPIEPLPFKLDTALCALLFFYIGILLNKTGFKYKLYDLRLGFKLGGIVFGAFAVFCAAKLNTYVNICDCYFGNPVLYLGGSLCGSLMVIFAASVLSKLRVKKVLSFIGSESLLIFAIHSFPMMIYAAIRSKILAQDFETIHMPFFAALIGVPVVLLMIMPVVLAKILVVKQIKGRKASGSNDKKAT